MKRIAVFFTLFLVSSFLSITCVHAADREAADELYRKSGLEKQMQDIGPAILAGYRHNYSKASRHGERDKSISSSIGGLVEEAFDPGVMRETVISGMMQGISGDDMEQVLGWLDSLTGKKVTALEERAGSKQGMAETQEYIRNIKNASLSEKRIGLVRDLNSAMNITRTTTDITLAIQFALSMTTEQARRKLNASQVKQLYEDFQKNRPQIASMVEHQVNGSLLYTYQELSDEELGQYVEFAGSAGGVAYHTVTSAHMSRAIVESCLLFAEKISQLQ